MKTKGFYLHQGQVEIIGLSGKARSGKDYLAKNVIVPLGFLPLALADHFKVDAVVKRGAPIHEVFFGEKSPRTRRLLQLLGTEKGRNKMGEDVWCKHLEVWIARLSSQGVRRFVITDVRFPNEVDWIHSLGGKVYRVTGRGGITPRKPKTWWEKVKALFGLWNDPASHPSETALDGFIGFDRVIDNSPENEDAVLGELLGYVARDFPSVTENIA